MKMNQRSLITSVLEAGMLGLIMLLTMLLVEAVGQPSLSQLIHEQINEDGDAELEQGHLVLREPLVIRNRSGVSITGKGRHRWPSSVTTGWNRKDVMRGTHIRYVGPPEEPAITIDSCSGVTLSDFGLTCDKGGTAVKFITRSGWGNNHHTLERLHVQTRGVGFDIGGGPSKTNSADLEFLNCTLRGCDTAYRWNDSQNVGYLIQGGYAYKCRTIFHIRHGGNVRAIGLDINQGAETVARIDQIGPNVSPTLSIKGMRIDRTSTATRPTLFDLSRIPGSGTVLHAEGISVIRKASDKGLKPKAAVIWPTSDAKVTINAISNSLNGVVRFDDRVRNFDRAKLITNIETTGGEQ